MPLRNQEEIPGTGTGDGMPTPAPAPAPAPPSSPATPGGSESGGDTAEGDARSAGEELDDGGGGGEEPPLPPLPPPPPANTPLAVQGSFARPGSSAANPFMTDTVMRDKARGGVREREMRFGAGSAGAGAPPPDEDLIAAIRAMRGKGGVR